MNFLLIIITLYHSRYNVTMSSKPVRIRTETIELLKKYAKPFETPNDCINRILSSELIPKEIKNEH